MRRALTMADREAQEQMVHRRNAKALIKGEQGVLDLLRDRMHAAGDSAMRKFFLSFDKNTDGKIDYDEFVRVTRDAFHGDVLSDAQMSHLFRALDKNGGGSIRYSELKSVLDAKPKAFLGTPTLGEKPVRSKDMPRVSFDARSSLIAEKLAAKREAGKLRQLFHELDTNGDGVLSRAALRRAALSVQPAATEEDLERFADAMGEEGGGGVDYNRFLRVMQGVQMGNDEGGIGNGPAEQGRPTLARLPQRKSLLRNQPGHGSKPGSPLFLPSQESVHRYGNIRNMINGTYGQLPSRLGYTPAPPDTMAWFKPPPGAPASDSAPRADGDLEGLRKLQAVNRGAMKHRQEAAILDLRASQARAMAERNDAKLANMNDRKDAMQERYVNPSNDAIHQRIGVRPFEAANRAMFQENKHGRHATLGVM